MKNKYLITFGVIAVVPTILFFSLLSPNKTALNGADFLKEYTQSSDAVMVDVRTPEEFNVGHISTAINVDYQNKSFESEIKKLDTTKTYFVYCRSGSRSAKAISVMKNNGFKKIYELQGGINSSQELLQ